MEVHVIADADARPHQPAVLASSPEGRAVVIELPAGEALRDHEVHERAWLVIIEGEVQVTSGDDSQTAGPGTLAVFDPKERHEVAARSDSRLLLLLSPWPGDGHPSEQSGRNGGAAG